MLTPPAALHALLFASGEPLEKKELASVLGFSDTELASALTGLAKSLEKSGVTLIETATEVELRTASEAAPIIKKFRETELARDLGKASLETLAVIAYQTVGTDRGGAEGADRGGATRSDIDWVRGVNSSASLRTLLLRGLIEGREDPKDKRRIRYSLTTEALAHLGVSSGAELPRAQELSAAARNVIEGAETEAEGAG
ncbi:SMC-Scp complex subunit ScpB [Candidatus Kaiserbacteria bacterium]|nr:SMC-Scp complex subunit ScpB [Candidatus Kaiserbacteria bacterium]